MPTERDGRVWLENGSWLGLREVLRSWAYRDQSRPFLVFVDPSPFGNGLQTNGGIDRGAGFDSGTEWLSAVVRGSWPFQACRSVQLRSGPVPEYLDPR